ncbi:MAG: hypothetical protein Q9182_004654 [Xanthomendoza sp. 2 TL-2023]
MKKPPLLLLTTLLITSPSLITALIPSPPTTSDKNHHDRNHSPIPPSKPPQVLGTPIPLLPDPCGPPIGQTDGRAASKSTCATSVDAGLPDDNPFKLTCGTDATGYTLNMEACRKSVNAACATLAYGRYDQGVGTDRWVWPAPENLRSNCTLGFWVPSNSSLLPNYNRCVDDIYEKMISGCEGDAKANVGSVNLKRLPHRTATERDTGESVNPSYPSELSIFAQRRYGIVDAIGADGQCG